ncbi:MAG: hypothetical protein WC733_02095 [Methylophilus sp.]|jgi:hypothetical protein
MITVEQYAGIWKHHEDWNGACQHSAELLLDRVNRLIADFVNDGYTVEINQKTKTQISGEVYGGFRPQDCPIGAKSSSHKLAMAVDVYDPYNKLDLWLDKHPEKLVEYDLYREHPSATQRWTHLSIKSPRSGKRTFLP